MRFAPERVASATAGVACAVLLGAGAAHATWPIGLATGGGEAAAGTAPPAPTGVTSACTSTTGATVSVSWNAVAGATSYTIWQSSISATTGFSAAATGVTGTSWVSGNLSTGSYWFQVSAVTGANWLSATSAATGPRLVAVTLCT